jgi:hypothetical protein
MSIMLQLPEHGETFAEMLASLLSVLLVTGDRAVL